MNTRRHLRNWYVVCDVLVMVQARSSHEVPKVIYPVRENWCIRSMLPSNREASCMLNNPPCYPALAMPLMHPPKTKKRSIAPKLRR